MANASLTPIYNRLNNAPKYHPLTAETFADWAMEAGDLVTVSRDGNSYTSPVSTSRMVWRGRQQINIESTGSKERPAISKVSRQKYSGSRGAGAAIANNNYIYNEVGTRARVFVSYTDPALTNEVSEGDFWVKSNETETWNDLSASTWTYSSVFNWNDYKGALVYVRDSKGTWRLVSDQQTLLDHSTRIEQDENHISLIAQDVEKVGDTVYRNYAELKVEQAQISADVVNAYAGLQSNITQTASSIMMSVEDSYNQMKSGLDITSSSLSAYVEDSYNQMKAGLDITSSSITSYVDDRYNGISSSLVQTASTFTVEVGKRARVYVRFTDPALAGEDVQEGDFWVKTNETETWNDMSGTSWTYSSTFNWNDYKGALTYVRDSKGGWRLISDQQTMLDHTTRIEQDEDHISLIAQDIQKIDGEVYRNYAELKVEQAQIKADVVDAVDELESHIIQTASSIMMSVEDNYNQLKSGLDLTSSSAALYVQDSYNQLKSGLDLTSSSASLYVDNKYTQMSAGLKLTSSSAALYVDNKYTQMSSGLKLSSSSAALYVNDRYNQLKSGLALTSSSAALYVNDRYNQLKSGLDLTSSSAALYVDNKYTQMSSGLKLSSSSAALYVNDRYNQLKSGLALTSSSAALYVNDRYNQLKSGLDLTSSSAALYVDNKYTQMSSGLKLSSSSAALYVDNKYDQMKSGLALTSSSASLYVDSKYDQLKAGLALTSSSAAVYVNDRYNQMKAGLAVTSSSAAVYATSADAAAKIVAEVNKTGSTIRLDADRVLIADNVTIDDTMTMSSGSLWIKKNISVGADATKLISINNGKINADEVQGNTFKFVNTGQSGGYRDITYDTVDTMIIKAEMDGNLLKLWKRGDSKDGNPSITFSKAVSLSGTWSGNRYTVTAKMDGVTLPNEDVVIPVVNPVGSSGGAYVDVYVATAKASGSGYDNHGTAKTLYLVKNGLTVYLKSQNSTTSGEVYAQTTCSNPYPNTITVRQAVGFQSLRKFEAFYKPSTGGDPVSLGTHYWYRSEKDLNKTQSDTTLRYA